LGTTRTLAVRRNETSRTKRRKGFYECRSLKDVSKKTREGAREHVSTRSSKLAYGVTTEPLPARHNHNSFEQRPNQEESRRVKKQLAPAQAPRRREQPDARALD